jgi:hypothetical protein
MREFDAITIGSVNPLGGKGARERRHHPRVGEVA